MKTLIKPCKGLKLLGGYLAASLSRVKTLIKPCKGLKHKLPKFYNGEPAGENANKTLQGIKTLSSLK